MPKRKKQPTLAGYKRFHTYIRQDLLPELWKIAGEKYVLPTRKLYLIINEALEQYIQNYHTTKSQTKQ